MLCSKSESNMCGGNSTTQLQYPVPMSMSYVATGCHSMFTNLVSHCTFVPTSNYELLKDVRVGSLLIAVVRAALLYLHAVRVGLGLNYCQKWT